LLDWCLLWAWHPGCREALVLRVGISAFFFAIPWFSPFFSFRLFVEGSFRSRLRARTGPSIGSAIQLVFFGRRTRFLLACMVFSDGTNTGAVVLVPGGLVSPLGASSRRSFYLFVRFLWVLLCNGGNHGTLFRRSFPTFGFPLGSLVCSCFSVLLFFFLCCAPPALAFPPRPAPISPSSHSF